MAMRRIHTTTPPATMASTSKAAMTSGTGTRSDATTNTIPKACIFDIGGVVVGSPLVGINRYEREHGLPRDYINIAITALGQKGAFQRLERSELDLYTFYRDFGRELSDAAQMNKWYIAFHETRGKSISSKEAGEILPSQLHVDGRELFGIMMHESTRIDVHVAEAIQRLRKSGKFILAALTNNFAPPTQPGGPDQGAAPTLDEELEHLGVGEGSRKIRHMFDHYIESAVVGMRKPELGFFKHALEVLGVAAHETVFLDDIGINLKAAQSLGMRTIRVRPDASLEALRELEQVVGMKLIGNGDGQNSRL